MKCTSSDSPVIKHVPQRTCVACRQIKDKKDLIRIVYTPDSGILIDDKGKKPGRGAYLCKTKECWNIGLNSNKLEYAIRTSISKDERRKLSDYAENL